VLQYATFSTGKGAQPFLGATVRGAAQSFCKMTKWRRKHAGQVVARVSVMGAWGHVARSCARMREHDRGGWFGRAWLGRWLDCWVQVMDP
jgi:hypothetical protein